MPFAHRKSRMVGKPYAVRTSKIKECDEALCRSHIETQECAEALCRSHIESQDCEEALCRSHIESQECEEALCRSHTRRGLDAHNTKQDVGAK